MIDQEHETYESFLQIIENMYTIFYWVYFFAVFVTW